MKSTGLAVFKYDHSESLQMAPEQKKAMWLALVLLVPCFFFSIVLGIVALLAFFFFLSRVLPTKTICLSPRYLLCGSTLLYYRNVDKLILDADKGNLTIFWDGKNVFRIERDKFPTNARKAPKIAVNKAAKFKKIADKIVAKVNAASPHAQLIGVGNS